MSLGANSGAVIRMLMSTGIRPVIFGSLLGLAISFAVGRLLGTLLFGIEGSDPMTFVSVALLLVGTAIAAAFLPAVRASRINPVTALHFE